MVAANELRERVAFETRGSSLDQYGNTQSDYAEQFVVPARIWSPRPGSEQVMAARLAGQNPVSIKVRHSSQTAQITTDWRARDARTGQLFNIRSVNLDERKRFVFVTAEVGVAT